MRNTWYETVVVRRGKNTKTYNCTVHSRSAHLMNIEHGLHMHTQCTNIRTVSHEHRRSVHSLPRLPHSPTLVTLPTPTWYEVCKIPSPSLAKA